MTKVFLIRHAEAEGNLFRRIHGQYDSCVTNNGLRQIRALRERFEGERIDACYSSDLLRTRTTAQAIYVPKHLPLHCDPRFREVRLGVWEDVPFGQLEMEQAEMLRRFNADPDNWRVEGAETFGEYSRRFLQAMTEAAERHAGEAIAIFTHGCVLRAAQKTLFYPDAGAGKLGHCDNTGVSLLMYENGAYRACYLNDNSHLSPDISTFARQRWWRESDGNADHNLWFRPMGREPERYIHCRRDAWESVYGQNGRFDGPAYYQNARRGTAGVEDALCEVMLRDRPVGVLELAVEQGAGENVGYIPFLYLRPELQGNGMGIQLIGQAVSFYRKRGRTRLQLCVSPRNCRALAFYRKYGFMPAGSSTGQFDELIRMEYNMDLQQAFPLFSDIS